MAHNVASDFKTTISVNLLEAFWIYGGASQDILGFVRLENINIVVSISIFPMRETLSDCLKGLCVLVTIVPVTCGSQRRAGILESAAHDEDEYRDDDDETELV